MTIKISHLNYYNSQECQIQQHYPEEIIEVVYYYCLSITSKTHAHKIKHAEEYIPVHFNGDKEHT